MTAYFQHLRVFLEAFREGSVSRAAVRLGISQPAASAQIRALETHLEKPLFERGARGVRPTAHGQDLAQKLASHLDALDLVLAGMKTRGTTLSGTIHIVGPAEFLTESMGDDIAKLTALGLQVRLHFGNRERIYALLREGTADLAITASTPDGRDLGHAALAQERLMLVAGPDLARRLGGRRLDPAALDAMPVVGYDEELPLVREYWRQVFEAEPQSAVAATAPDLRLVLNLVARNAGYSVLPDYLAHGAISRGEIVEIGRAGAGPGNRLNLVWLKSNLRSMRIAAARDALLQRPGCIS